MAIAVDVGINRDPILFEAPPVVFRENFTGNGTAKTFTLTGVIQNATWKNGIWDIKKVLRTKTASVTNSSGGGLYDSAVYLYRDRISVVSISAAGLVTLDYIPRAEVFSIYYWYQPARNDVLDTYIRDDIVSAAEVSEPGLANAVYTDTTNFGKNLSSADDTVQKALDKLDDLTTSGGHTQGTDTTLGAMTADVNMNTHKLTGLTVPVNAGDSIRATAKITEILLESATDLKHSNTLDHSNSLDHARQHGIAGTADHTSGITSGKIIKADTNGLPAEGSNTDSQVAGAVSASHAQGTDTALGTMAFDVAMGTHKLTGLSVPASNGDSIRATAKITEALLESATDLKHSNALDHAAVTLGVTNDPQFSLSAQTLTLNKKVRRVWFGA